jgi:hypothetical protein
MHLSRFIVTGLINTIFSSDSLLVGLLFINETKVPFARRLSFYTSQLGGIL